MRVGVYYNNKDVRVEERAMPVAGDNEILIKVMACGICGSDIMEWYRIKRAPLVLGHELTGEIVSVGKNITAFKPGDRVYTTHHVPCNECHYCLTGHETACETFQTVNNFDSGGFSEYLKVGGRSLQTGTFKLPDSMTWEQGSFIEPLATAVRALRTVDLKPAETVAILGCGLAGLLIIQLARALGAAKVVAVDINDYRMEQAKIFGATHSVNAAGDVQAYIKSINNGRLADKVLICNGALASANQAMTLADRGGCILFFAVPRPGETLSIDFNPFWRNDVSIKTCYGAAPIDNVQAMKLIESGNIKVDEMITHRLTLGEIQKGFQIACDGKDCLKVIIEPQRK